MCAKKNKKDIVLLQKTKPNNHKMIILYILIVCYLLFLICAKIYSPFWFHQPVYHIYEIYPRFVYRPYLKLPQIEKRRPNSYCDFVHMDTFFLSDMNDSQIKKITSFLKTYYLQTEHFLFDITTSILQKQFTGMSMITTQYEDKFYEVNNNIQKKRDEENPLGCILSRPLYLFFTLYEEKYVLFYMDYICQKKGKQNSRSLIQTHIHQAHQQVSDIKVHLFKKEVHLCNGIVPLVHCQTFTFFLEETPIQKLPIGLSIRRISSKEINTWRALYYQILSYFEVVLLPEINITIQWILDEIYHIYILLYIDPNKIQHVYGVYFFQNKHTIWDVQEKQEKNHVMQLQSSMKSPLCSELFFFRGFLHSIRSFLLEHKEIGILVMESISDNIIILNRWQEKYPLRNETDTAYYLYNLVYPKSPIQNSRFFLL